MILSIITINKNNKTGLQKTMESVFMQNFIDFEYIVIDGASTDGSVEVIQHFSNTTFSYGEGQGERLFWISEPDSGVYQAMNKGIKMANGEYLLFLNSGDFLVEDNVLEKVFEDHTLISDIICARCNVSDNGTVVWTSNPPQDITFGTLYNQGLAHQSTFIRKRLFNHLGYYREDFRYNSDIEFWYRAIILNNVSTYTIDVIVSDYNLEGISSNENTSQAYKNEMNEILSQPLLQRFIPDYENWKKDRVEMEVMYWAKSKAFLYNTLKGIYVFAIFIQKLKKK